MKHLTSAVALFGACLLGLSMPAHATSHAGGATASSPAAMATGEIRKVDKEAKKLTIRHGPLENLDMPPMTMVFQVADPAVLDQVKAGDKVRFAAEKKDGAYVVTQVEAVR